MAIIKLKLSFLIERLIFNKKKIKIAISSANDLVNKIVLSSTLSLDTLPQLDLLDFHKKRDMIKEYKVKYF